MWIGIGSVEVILLSGLVIASLAACWARWAARRWLIAATILFGIAVCLTPADPLSSLLLTLLLLAAFSAGTWLRRPLAAD